jgi:hypothetical protein
MAKKSKKNARKSESDKDDEDSGRVIFVRDRLRKQELEADEIIVRLPLPRESKWSGDDLGLSDRGKGSVGGVTFSHYGDSVKTKIDKKVRKAIKLNKLQVVIGRLGNRVGA